MDALQVSVPDSVLTSDVTVSLASAVGVILPSPGNHGDVPVNDLSNVRGLVNLVETDSEKSAVLCEEDSGGVSLSNGSGNEVIQMLLQPQEGVSDAGSGTVDLPDTSVLAQNQQGPMQAVTLADGSTAYIQHKKGATKFFEGQAVTLEDGSTAIVQGSSPLKDNSEQAIQADIAETKFVDGQAVQLEDGTTAFIHNAHKGEGFQAIQLEDGTTAYLASNVAEGLFGEAGHLDTTAIPLGQLEPQTTVTDVSQHTNTQDTSAPTTVTIISASEELVDNLVLADKTFRCSFEGCGRLYTTQHHLKVHERSHTGDRPFKCEHPGCAKGFATAYGLKSHTRVHTGEKPYKCTEAGCSKAFKTSGDLQKHVRTHTGERPFKCPFEGCDRSFTTSNIRKVHIRTHTGERPYVCTEAGCGRAFASATNYKNHIRIHTGEKPYVCTVQNCGKRFTEYSSLYKHHVVHTHAKPYECNHCNKNYRQTSTLAMHKRTAHNEDISTEAEAELYAQQSAELGDISDMKRPRLTINPVNDANLGDTAQGQVGDQEGTLVINTTQAITLQDLQHQGLASVSMGDAGQIFVVTDPGQLEALQQLAVQHLELQPTGGVDVLGSIDIIAEPTPPGTIIESVSESSTLLQDQEPGE